MRYSLKTNPAWCLNWQNGWIKISNVVIRWNTTWYEGQQGTKNSQYGTCWVTHPDLGNKKIKKEQLEEYITLGYSKGRRIVV